MKKPNNFAVDYQKLPRKLRHSGRDHFNLGIEVRSFDKFTLAIARQNAEAHDLAFSRDLSGILT